MTTQEIQEIVKEILGKDPIEMCVNYYKGLIRISTDRIAKEQKQIKKLQRRIDELKPPTKGGNDE